MCANWPHMGHGGWRNRMCVDKTPNPLGSPDTAAFCMLEAGRFRDGECRNPTCGRLAWTPEAGEDAYQKSLEHPIPIDEEENRQEMESLKAGMIQLLSSADVNVRKAAHKGLTDMHISSKDRDVLGWAGPVHEKKLVFNIRCGAVLV